MNIYKVKGGEDKVQIILSTTHIESVNNLYRARVAYKSNGKKGKVAYPVIYKSPEASAYSNELIDQLNTIDFHADHPWIFEADYFSVIVTFLMNRSFNARDLDNCLKITTDALFGHVLELNDSRIINWMAWKRYQPDSPLEYVMIEISKESADDIMFSSGL